ncbi:NAD(P)H-dependent glycerol-3-phosphate dehydrogenase [Candidatus Arthromitus sp. SFB-turkey]|uniref:NAD(P)H-dependent glycerol-3-phosphate dehydrogenase n=1 Tax=Candidatus Arthromitus sp. SFB-turkey TaxID=1840217 RepID=UPI0007F5331D|nr:NAD(P)H-dependent glycerol-3-phosphate dehydrogenase [Candidatus Arthromitus sp. SFB-turkey]OAT87606.1 glycerol-3-phosphate dehydrogenase [Candidatus Arthromitus sp. SFB-turkey]HJD00686.1 NAD(P)H-dependent glycerol-3-phosphate dehydrogenase [Candidatus Dwaynia gallinarum]
MNLTFLGSGSFGTALAVIFSNYDFKIKMFDRNMDVVNGINEKRKNIKYLKNIHIPEKIIATNDINDAINNSDIIFFAVPSHAVREISKQIKDKIDSKSVIVCLSKGIEQDTHKRLSEILEEELPHNPIVILSGPSHAEEIALRKPTALVSTSKDMKFAELIRDTLSNDVLRIYTNSDIVGVEIGGSMKNVIALAIGIITGMGYGDNSSAAIITRSLQDIVKMGVSLGGKLETFFGLTGIGDLIVTCLSEHSRNRKCGLLIGKGMKLDEAIKEIGMVVEGINACKIFYEIAKEKNIEVPIIESLYEVLFNNKDLRSIEGKLMSRDRKDEFLKI